MKIQIAQNIQLTPIKKMEIRKNKLKMKRGLFFSIAALFLTNTEGSDWNLVIGDNTNATAQRNMGDYITLASDNNKLIAVWTDGRSGKTQL